MPPGELAIVLHTHMPYVEGFDTWPFGEEWLWEAIATSYLPLLPVLERAPLTLSLTPVLCDQLEAPGALDRCRAFLRSVRAESHRLDLETARAQRTPQIAAELQRSAAEYAAAERRLGELGDGGLLRALGAHTSWTSSATHAILPLIASDAGLALQLETGVASHRRRFGRWEGGLWLPECAHAPWLHGPLEEAGVRATCVELTDRFGLGDPRHLTPLATDDGPVLWPIDRASMALAWGEHGYPAAGPYRAYHRFEGHRHRVWSNDGTPYDHARARTQAVAHAAEFVGRVIDRVAGGGVCVCAFDTELFGHWWYEGVEWLAAVVEECGRQGLSLTGLDGALERHEPVPAPEQLGTSSWGVGGDLRTWSGPAVAEMASEIRRAELRLLAAPAPPPGRALRELLALQSSDWAFLVSTDLARAYARERAAGHAAGVERALAGDPELAPELRHLAPVLAGWAG